MFPYFFQVLLDLPFGSKKILGDERILIVATFLVENFERFALGQQSLVDGVASSCPNCCFHLVPVRVGENVIDVGRIGARFSDFGHLSPKVAASFSPSELPFFAN